MKKFSIFQRQTSDPVDSNEASNQNAIRTEPNKQLLKDISQFPYPCQHLASWAVPSYSWAQASQYPHHPLKQGLEAGLSIGPPIIQAV